MKKDIWLVVIVVIIAYIFFAQEIGGQKVRADEGMKNAAYSPWLCQGETCENTMDKAREDFQKEHPCILFPVYHLEGDTARTAWLDLCWWWPGE